MNNFSEELKNLITNYYPAFQGKIGEENKRALTSTITDLVKQVVPSEEKLEECSCGKFDEEVICSCGAHEMNIGAKGFNSCRTEILKRLESPNKEQR